MSCAVFACSRITFVLSQKTRMRLYLLVKLRSAYADNACSHSAGGSRASAGNPVHSTSYVARSLPVLTFCAIAYAHVREGLLCAISNQFPSPLKLGEVVTTWTRAHNSIESHHLVLRVCVRINNRNYTG